MARAASTSQHVLPMSRIHLDPSPIPSSSSSTIVPKAHKCCCCGIPVSCKFVCATTAFTCLSLAILLFFLFPRFDVKMNLVGKPKQSVSYRATGAPLPIFSILMQSEITISNPNYIPFELEDVELRIFHQSAESASAIITQPIVTLRMTSPASYSLQQQSSSSSSSPTGASEDLTLTVVPGLNKFLTSVSLNSNADESIAMSHAIACARSLYGKEKQCELKLQIIVQPRYLGIGRGLIPRVSYDMPLTLGDGV